MWSSVIALRARIARFALPSAHSHGTAREERSVWSTSVVISHGRWLYAAQPSGPISSTMMTDMADESLVARLMTLSDLAAQMRCQ